MNLTECKREMRSIVAELENIRWGVRYDFVENIGEKLTADCIEKIHEKYKYVSSKLDEVDLNLIAKWIDWWQS